MIPPVLGNIVPNQKNKRKYYDLYEWNKIYYTPIPKPLKNQLKSRFSLKFFVKQMLLFGKISETDRARSGMRTDDRSRFHNFYLEIFIELMNFFF